MNSVFSFNKYQKLFIFGCPLLHEKFDDCPRLSPLPRLVHLWASHPTWTKSGQLTWTEYITQLLIQAVKTSILIKRLISTWRTIIMARWRHSYPGNHRPQKLYAQRSRSYTVTIMAKQQVSKLQLQSKPTDGRIIRMEWHLLQPFEVRSS